MFLSLGDEVPFPVDLDSADGCAGGEPAGVA